MTTALMVLVLSQTQLDSRVTPGVYVAASAAAVRPNTFIGYYDINGDGRLSPEEVPSELLQHFSKTDANGDRFLDEQEILSARTRIGQLARKTQGLRLGLFGNLKSRNGATADYPIDRLPAPVVIPTAAVSPAVQSPATPSVDWAPVTEGGSLPPVRSAIVSTVPPQQGPTEAPTYQAAPVQSAPMRPEQGKGTVPAPATTSDPTKGDGYPEPHEIIENLDVNGNGMIDRDEAVDQLADRFQMIDKNRDGALSVQELDRALRLAKMFGIKPNVDPRKYQRK